MNCDIKEVINLVLTAQQNLEENEERLYLLLNEKYGAVKASSVDRNVVQPARKKAQVVEDDGVIKPAYIGYYQAVSLAVSGSVILEIDKGRKASQKAALALIGNRASWQFDTSYLCGNGIASTPTMSKIKADAQATFTLNIKYKNFGITPCRGYQLGMTEDGGKICLLQAVGYWTYALVLL